MKFSLKRYQKDRQKSYEMSMSGINLDQLSKTEDRITSQSIKTTIKVMREPDKGDLHTEAENCNKRSVLGLCTLPVKDRDTDKCKLCSENV